MSKKQNDSPKENLIHVNDCKYVQIKLDCKYVHIYQNFLVCKQRKMNCARHTVEVGISLINIVDSLTAWLVGVQLNPVFLFPLSKVVSESTISE